MRTKTKDNKRVFVETEDLPLSYNSTNVTLIPRDPFWIYAYWEIEPSSIESLKKKIGDEFGKFVYTLRMYDVTYIDFKGNNANRRFDLDFNPTATNNWYINLWKDNVTYCGEIGLRSPDEKFFALARSNFVTTPPLNPSNRSDTIWMQAKGNSKNPAFVVAQKKEPSSPQAKKSTRRIYLTEDDIRAYYSRFLPLLRLISRRKKSRAIYSGFDRLKEAVDLDSVITGNLPKDKFVERLLLGSSQERLLKGASELVRGGASEKEEKKRKFFFEIGTELIVYGRTEPDAVVWFGNKKLKLRSDGTFSLRFSLPEGKIPLDFVAQSRDKMERRRIQTSVERTKTKT